MTPETPTLEAIPAGTNEGLWQRLVREGRAAYRVEGRGSSRQRARLQSAKILDGAGAFLCEATIQDYSTSGLRLMLQRNCGLPSRFGVHLDLTQEIWTGTQAWRRERVVGVRILVRAAPAPLKPSDRSALAGRYYAVPN